MKRVGAVLIPWSKHGPFNRRVDPRTGTTDFTHLHELEVIGKVTNEISYVNIEDRFPSLQDLSDGRRR